MEQIASMGQYRQMTEELRAKCGNVVGNVYATDPEMGKAIAEGRIFCEQMGHALILYRDEGDYWQAMFLMEKGWAPKAPLPKTGKPCYLVITNTGRMKDGTRRLMDAATSLGFMQTDTYTLFRIAVPAAYRAASEYLETAREDMKRRGFLTLPFAPGDREAIHAIWGKYLPRSNYPREQWMLKGNLDGLFLLFDTRGCQRKLAATIWLRKEGTAWFGTGFAVEEAYRHDMAGIYIQALMYEWAGKQGIPVCHAWIADGNRRALAVNKFWGAKEMPVTFLQYRLER